MITTMQVLENISLKPFNTFRIDAKARYFASFRSLEMLMALLEQQPTRKSLVLGGGSNVLFTKDFDGIVFRNEITGIDKVDEDENYVYIKCGAGENWHRASH